MLDDTVVLRFRDLITAPGRTIREHRALIDQTGATWWGWWRRPYEVVPTVFLTALSERCPIDIYLLDTGARDESFELFRATVDDIAVTPTGSDIGSPDVSRTPPYYNTAMYPVWFRMSALDLDPANVDLMVLYSLPTWPQGSDPDVAQVIGQPITTQRSLRRLDVTMWHVGIEFGKDL